MTRQHQAGYVLLALLLVLFVAGASFLTGAMNQRQSLGLAQQQETLYQLASAKEALINYASFTHQLYQGQLGPGYLPCPDTDGNGSADQDSDARCTGTTLGRLPRTVATPGGPYQLSDPTASSDQQLWYAVSPRHLPGGGNNDAASKMDRSLARLTLDGNGQYAAVLFIPGAALAGQDRAANPLLASHYLEAGNASPQGPFSTSAAAEGFNDIVLGISHDELMAGAGFNAAARIKRKLDAYHAGNGQYPPDSFSFWILSFACVPAGFVNSLADDDAWLQQEGWASSSTCFASGGSYRRLNFIDYQRQSANRAVLRFAGCSIAYTVTMGGGIEPSGTAC